jgi:hypothetical protein
MPSTISTASSPKAPGRPKKVWTPEELALKEAKAASVKAQKALEKEAKAFEKAQEKAAKAQAKEQEKAAKALAKEQEKAAKAAAKSPMKGGGSMHSIPLVSSGLHTGPATSVLGMQGPSRATLMQDIHQCHMRLGALLGALHNMDHGLC